jgi:copper chaperone CopZ
MSEYTISVRGLHCPGCENLVTRELNPIPGITDAKADSENGEVAVRGDRRTKDRARQAIAELGYEPVA